MRVLEPDEIAQRRAHREQTQKKKRRKHVGRRLLLVLIMLYVLAAIAIPLPVLQGQSNLLQPAAAQNINLPWPSYGQAAIGAVGYGLFAQHGEQKQVPTASLAKIITALAVLKVKPIIKGQPPQMITITGGDVETYNNDSSQGQSVVLVTNGESISEYQALQAMLLPSANNMADILVRWAFGSTDNYLTFVNTFVKSLGMSSTSMADASGFSPQTVSSAVDLMKVAEIAMNDTTVADIVGQTQADVPVAGTVYNINHLVGQAGIVGIKTGNTDQAGGCYMFAAKRDISNGHSVTVVGSIMGAPDLDRALADAQPLVNETFNHFAVTTPFASGQQVGSLTQTNGKQVPMVIQQGEAVLTWAGQPVTAEAVIDTLKSSVQANEGVGYLNMHVGNLAYKLPLIAGQTIPPRSLWWRLSHAGGLL